MKNKLPKNWVETELNNIISFVIGGDWGKDPSKIDDADFEEVSCIRGSEIKNWSEDKGSTASIRKIKKSSLEKRELIFGDILIEISGGGPDQPVGRILFIDEEALEINSLPKVCTNFLRLLRVNSLLNQKFISRFLEYFYVSGKVIQYQGGSNNLRNLKFKDYQTIKIPFPSRTEQDRVVAKLDGLFEQLESINKSLVRIPTLLKNFRQQVLTQAVTGKLTEEWREGKKLESQTESYLEKIFADIQKAYEIKCSEAKKVGNRKPKDQRKNKKSDKEDNNLPKIPSGWKYIRAEELSYLITDGVHFRPKYTENGIPFLSVKNVRPFSISEKDCKYISEDDHDEYIKRCNPEFGDILYTKVGATFGYAALIKNDLPFSIYVSLALIKPSKLLLSKFIELLFNSQLIFNQARHRVSGSGVPDLHLIEIRDFKIPVTIIEEQQEIVNRVEVLLAKADIIEKHYETLKVKIEQLPQAILHKAFKGELVPQLESDGDAKKLFKEIEELKDNIVGNAKNTNKRK